MGNLPKFQNDPYFDIYNLEGRNYPNYSWNNQGSYPYNQQIYQSDAISSLRAIFEEFNQVCEEVNQVCEGIMFKSRMLSLETTLEKFMQQIEENLKIQGASLRNLKIQIEQISRQMAKEQQSTLTRLSIQRSSVRLLLGRMVNHVQAREWSISPRKMRKPPTKLTQQMIHL